MKFLRNEDGTMNIMPVVIIVTLLCGACFYFVFSSLLNTTPAPQTDDRIITTRTTEKTTIQLCNGCSLSFKESSFDVSTNGSLDLSEIVKLDKVSINFIKFSLDNDSIASIQGKRGTFYLNTGTNTGTVKLKAEYADQTSEATLNIVNPTNKSISFKYPYYFVKSQGEITPELVTYPLGLDIKDAEFSQPENMDHCANVDSDTGRVSGNEVGEDIIKVTKDGITASTKIYVVENLITVKVHNGEQYKAVREYYPNEGIFDILVVLDKSSYGVKDLNVYKLDGSLNINAAYVSKGTELNSFVYHIETSGSGEGTLRVDLANGSFTNLIIKK